ncbi:hypothetical protein [Candidatus Protochlamydia naegleriophila]|nr:hypothetical protein [Candidatus Protochlamydia naegleriophila]
MQHHYWFICHGILALFTGLMLYVTYVAFSRHSGSTGLDMAHIQKVRYEAQQARQTPPRSFPTTTSSL